jgi:cysteine synthase A
MSLIESGGTDMLMSSTAYGGCSQLADVMDGLAPTFRKSTFDIQGDVDMVASISGSLDALASTGAALNPTTVLFIECPTNPAMKVPEVNELALALKAYKAKTGKAVLLLVDTTFAPNSNVLAKIHAITPELPAMVFISMSKSISRGLTTAGGIVANHTAEAVELIHRVKRHSTMLDTKAKADQMHFLIANHNQVEERCVQSYKVAVAAGEALQHAVKAARGVSMPLQFVTPAHAAVGFTSSTVSFNLPPPAAATTEITAGLAQRFVDLLCVDKQFKPCVSFGQDNGLVYCTVPATSTQGAIKDEHKAKQAVGGVQITRLSFPPTCDLPALLRVVERAVNTIYQPAKL